MAHTVEDVMIIITWPWSTRPSLVGEIRQEIDPKSIFFLPLSRLIVQTP